MSTSISDLTPKQRSIIRQGLLMFSSMARSSANSIAQDKNERLILKVPHNVALAAALNDAQEAEALITKFREPGV